MYRTTLITPVKKIRELLGKRLLIVAPGFSSFQQ
jgi:hypothetical protein